MCAKGKSVLASQIISFLRQRSSNKTLFFFCDYQTPTYGITAQIFRAYLAQLVRSTPEAASYIYDEHLAKGHSPIAKVLKAVLASIIKQSDFVRLIVDGVDELQSSEHRRLLEELIQLTKVSGDSCKLLISSQDLPSIRPTLGSKLVLFLGNAEEPIKKDIALVVNQSMERLSNALDGILDAKEISSIQEQIVNKAEGLHWTLSSNGAITHFLCRHVSLGSPSFILTRDLPECCRASIKHLRVAQRLTGNVRTTDTIANTGTLWTELTEHWLT